VHVPVHCSVCKICNRIDISTASRPEPGPPYQPALALTPPRAPHPPEQHVAQRVARQPPRQIPDVHGTGGPFRCQLSDRQLAQVQEPRERLRARVGSGEFLMTVRD
jgi:hypothetical protein